MANTETNVYESCLSKLEECLTRAVDITQGIHDPAYRAIAEKICDVTKALVQHFITVHNDVVVLRAENAMLTNENRALRQRLRGQ